MYKEGFKYLKSDDNDSPNWRDLTRDERTYCMSLFKAFEEAPEKLLPILKLNKFLKSRESNREFVSTGKKWEIGFEVCFYRDLLKANNILVKGQADKLMGWGIDDPSKLIKRTFDLCLFSEDEIIIIEAKAAERLTSKQVNEFLEDRNYIETIFKKGLNRKSPEVKTVLLVSSSYLDSSSFDPPRGKQIGVGYKYVLPDKLDGIENPLTAVISWQNILKFMNDNDIGSEIDRQMIANADAAYPKPKLKK